VAKLRRSLSRWLSIPFLLIVGLVALAFAWRVAGTRGANAIVAVLLLVWFACWMGAFLRFLQRRGQTPAPLRQPAQAAQADPSLEGTVYGLEPGAEYRVVQTFSDFYDGEFTRGERLRFKRRNFLPYHGGHTIEFDERTLYLQEDANREILSDFRRYIARVE